MADKKGDAGGQRPFLHVTKRRVAACEAVTSFLGGYFGLKSRHDMKRRWIFDDMTVGAMADLFLLSQPGPVWSQFMLSNYFLAAVSGEVLASWLTKM